MARSSGILPSSDTEESFKALYEKTLNQLKEKKHQDYEKKPLFVLIKFTCMLGNYDPELAKPHKKCLEQIGYVLDNFDGEMQNQLIIYLLGHRYRKMDHEDAFDPIERLGNTLIEKFFLKKFEQQKLFNLLKLINEITHQFLKIESQSQKVVEKYDAIVNQFIKQYEDNLITLDTLSDNCEILFSTLQKSGTSLESFSERAHLLLTENTTPKQLADNKQQPLEAEKAPVSTEQFRDQTQKADITSDQPTDDQQPPLEAKKAPVSTCVIWFKILLGVGSLIAGGYLLIVAAGATNLLVYGGILAATGIGLFAHGMYEKCKNPVAHTASRINPS